jgi:hypothetical protein
MQATPYDGDRGAAFRVRLLPARLRLPIEGAALGQRFRQTEVKKRARPAPGAVPAHQLQVDGLGEIGVTTIPRCACQPHPTRQEPLPHFPALSPPKSARVPVRRRVQVRQPSIAEPGQRPPFRPAHWPREREPQGPRYPSSRASSFPTNHVRGDRVMGKRFPRLCDREKRRARAVAMTANLSPE